MSSGLPVTLSPPCTVPSAAVLSQMADVLPWPLLLLRPDAMLLQANLAARQLLQRGQHLSLDRRQHVSCTSPEHQAGFLAGLRAGQPTQLEWPASPLAATPAGCKVTLKPLAGGPADGEGEAPGQAPVLVMLGTASQRHGELLAFARMHAFTRAETRVLEQLSLGRTAVRAAAALGVRPATVRSQVTSLRRKSGHASVIQVLRALARMPPVLPLHLVPSPRHGAGE